MTRLERLQNLHARIEQEIQREERFQERIRSITTAAALASTTRPGWTEQVLIGAARYYDVTVDNLRSSSRDKDVTDARHIAAWLLRQDGRSYPEIGTALHKDHTTAMNAVKRVNGTPRLMAAAASVRGELVGEVAS